jgi:hypothetical protein
MDERRAMVTELDDGAATCWSRFWIVSVAFLNRKCREDGSLEQHQVIR